MKQLFQFEFKKYFKKKTTWIAVFTSILFVSSLYFLNYSVAKDIQRGNLSFAQYSVNISQQALKELELQKIEAERNGDVEKITESKLAIQEYQQSLSKKNKWITNYSQGNWQDLYEENVNQLQFMFKSSKGTNSFPLVIEKQNISLFTPRATLEELVLLKKIKAEPFIQNTIHTPFLFTIYDQFTGSSLEQWEKSTMRYGTTGSLFLYQIIQYYYIPVLILLGCFIFGNNISSEMNNKKRGLHFYYTLPIKRKSLFITKYFSGFLSTIVFVLLMLLIPLLCSYFTKGVGSFNYPVLIYEGSEPNPFGSEYNSLNPIKDQFHFITLKNYFGQVLLLTVLLTFFLYSFYYISSLVLKSLSITTSIIGIITFIGMKSFSSPYNPFTYVNIHSVLTGETATLVFNPSINLSNGIMLTFVLGCTLLFAGYKLFIRKYN
ncbi:ABC transporter permease subunit [Bacillus wiedmannii]|uniref:ABC transporter permease subunit n=1 Tax=Bacillus TaxID=1386 RepID=UPI0011453A00|nr:ABC transporter permease subunit [Bacillus wiedmannii]MDI6508559.1 ABC transporter permease subunit [Bacillus wiedmannii]MDI6514341.1 ABC transporter permease subunit [Bacillus wiedmannii]HDR7657984.1 ABC transporter permease [Bacillus wiedmannii]